ncbi:acyl-CoA synthetase FdrA [Candidatus Bipolaricaulota bacterium]|nr:acyl-CoA synthetase FdrA [Candidatus Bipolaricaulota bacterium]
MKTVLIESDRYFDSVFLMQISRRLQAVDGVVQAVVSMGTPTNIDHLARVGFRDAALTRVLPNDLVIALETDTSKAAEAARIRLGELLGVQAQPDPGDDAVSRATFAAPTTIPHAARRLPGANLALISVPGEYAAREARIALREGLHVMLFSDNVSVEDEISLKDEAIRRRLLMMGPDCGTAIINGKPLGFANAVRRGRIGIVGASGTGIQEISSLVHRLGAGVSQAIGTGGRDLSEQVEGRMSVLAIEALAGDPDTDVIVLVSKTPSSRVAEIVLEKLASCGKPGVVHFVGADTRLEKASVTQAGTLAEAALDACRVCGVDVPESISVPTIDSDLSKDPEAPRAARETGHRRLVGLFCGGTLCQEAWAILRSRGIEAGSNVAPDPAWRVRYDEQEPIRGHVLWDLGDDRFTVGRPHPMIEPSLRGDVLQAVVQDPSVAAVLVDLVLGYGAHPLPGEALAVRVNQACKLLREQGRNLLVIGSITGTNRDPQNLDRQRRLLEEAGVLVAESNAAAALAAAGLIERWMKGDST